MSLFKIEKVKEWLIRYSPSEAFGILTAYAGFYYGMRLSGNHFVAAYMASITENIGFYLPLLIRDMRESYKEKKSQGLSFGSKDAGYVCLGLLAECGVAEFFDSLFIRPLAISFATEHCGPELGILLGKIFGDFFFYIPAIMIYEYRKVLKKRYELKKQKLTVSV